MPRYKIVIEYDGTPYQGWQLQHNFPSVQEALAGAIKAFSGEWVIAQGAGRTDAGVHATGQVAHIDLTRDWRPDQVREAINANMRPHPVSIISAERVDDNFQARFGAIRRAYRYVILNRRSPPALLANRVWHVKYPLDAEAMHRAAQRLVGHHDFTTFRNTNCQAKSPCKTLDQLDVRREDELIIIDTSSRSYLHNQVRSMVGSLKKVGDGTHDEAWISRILDARERKACGPVAPAAGLTLTRVDYGSADTGQPASGLDNEIDE